MTLSDRQGESWKTIHFANFMTCIISKIRSWTSKSKNTIDESCYGAISVEMDLGITQHFGARASASHMTAAKVMDVISRLPGCSGRASDAVSAYTQTESKDAPELLKMTRGECLTISISLPTTRRPKSWILNQNQLFRWKETNTDIYWQVYNGNVNSRKLSWKERWVKLPGSIGISR